MASGYPSAVDDWTQRYATALFADPGMEGSSGDQKRVLELARIVAHGTARKNAPLTTFIAGRYCALREAQGESPSTALSEAIDVAERLIAEIEKG